MRVECKSTGLIDRLWNEMQLSRLRFFGLAVLVFVPQSTCSVLIQDGIITANSLIMWFVSLLTSGALFFPIRGRVRDFGGNVRMWTWFFVVLFAAQYLIIFAGQMRFLVEDDARVLLAAPALLAWIPWLCLLFTPGSQKGPVKSCVSEIKGHEGQNKLL